MTGALRYTLALLLLLAAACESSAGPSYATIEVGNSVRTRTEARVTVEAATAPQDTLYDRLLPAGAWACGRLPSAGQVRVIVRTADTVVTVPPFALEQAPIWVVAVLMDTNGLAVQVSARPTSPCT